MQNGRDFEDALYAYMKPFLVKGIPSLFSDLKGLYRSAAVLLASAVREYLNASPGAYGTQILDGIELAFLSGRPASQY